MSAGGEIFEAKTNVEILSEAGILALRQLGDLVHASNRKMDGMVADIREVREGQIKLEAQKLENQIRETRQELLDRIKEMERESEQCRISYEQKIDADHEKVQSLTVDLARMRGVMLPLTVLGTSILTAIASFLASHTLGKF